MKIIHISDLHLDINKKKINFEKTEYLFEKLVNEGFDHLVISGDITENAEGSAFQLARELLKKFRLLSSDKTTVVIGNHDIYGGVHLAEDIINFPAKCKSTSYYEKVKEFEYYFRETFENTIAPVKSTYFPFIKEFDDFVLVGFNSISPYSVVKNPFASNGIIHKAQIKAIEKIIGHKSFSQKAKIAIAHHHFCRDKSSENKGTLWQAIEWQTMKLKNKKITIKRLKQLGVNIVLHGHLHETAQYSRKGIKFINSGGSILGYKQKEIRITEINISKKYITTHEKIFNSEYANKVSKEFKIPKGVFSSVYTPHEISLN